MHHCRTNAHLVEEHRIQKETPSLPLYDRHCNELTGMAVKNAKERAKREYPISPKLGDYYLRRVGRLKQTDQTPGVVPDKEICSQLNLFRIGLVHGGYLDTLIALWDDLVRETKTIEPISQHDWRPYRVFVSRVLFFCSCTKFQCCKTCGSYFLRLSVLPYEAPLICQTLAGISLQNLSRCISRTGFFTSILISPLCSFLSLIEQDVHLCFAGAISCVLPQRVNFTYSFCQILHRFDFSSVLDFLFMHLQSACGSSWLSALPEIHKVKFHFFLLFHVLSNVLLLDCFRTHHILKLSFGSLQVRQTIPSFFELQNYFCQVS